MNCSGVIRRVDELGRVVIPIEIRRLLGIKEGESLEFIIRDNCIEIKKKSVIENNQMLFNEIFEKLCELIEGRLIITDREKVFHSSDYKILNKSFDENIKDLLSTHNDTTLNNTSLLFDDYCIKSTFYIYPYYSESDIAGFIILYEISSIDKYLKLIKFITSYIHDKLSL